MSICRLGRQQPKRLHADSGYCAHLTDWSHPSPTRQVAQWAAAVPWMRWLAFWSINRDRWDGTEYVSPSASSIPQQPYDFLKTAQAHFPAKT